MCVSLCMYLCVAICVYVCMRVANHKGTRKSISSVMKMQIVFLVSTCTVNQHHNAPSPFSLSQNGPQSTWTWLGQITPSSHFPHSLQINQSPLLLCSPLMSILYSFIDFCHPSICLNCFVFIPPFNSFHPSRGRFVNGNKKELVEWKTIKRTGSWRWMV